MIQLKAPMNSFKVCLCHTIISRTHEPPCAYEYEILKNISRSIISFGAHNCVKHSRNYAWGSRNFHYITRALVRVLQFQLEFFRIVESDDGSLIEATNRISESICTLHVNRKQKLSISNPEIYSQQFMLVFQTSQDLFLGGRARELEKCWKTFLSFCLPTLIKVASNSRNILLIYLTSSRAILFDFEHAKCFALWVGTRRGWQKR